MLRLTPSRHDLNNELNKSAYLIEPELDKDSCFANGLRVSRINLKEFRNGWSSVLTDFLIS